MRVATERGSTLRVREKAEPLPGEPTEKPLPWGLISPPRKVQSTE
jgi:hypothetical protein